MKAEVFVVVVVGLLLLMAVFPQHIYDVPNAMFFSTSLLLLERRQLTAFAVLYPLSCLNRETTILLTLLFAVHFFGQMDRRTYWLHLAFQCMVYALIFVTIRLVFAGAPGHDFYPSLVSNLQRYIQAPLTTTILLLVVAAIAGLLLVKWQRAPLLMRTALLIFAPILIVMHLLIGRAFEVRVFIELLPVVSIIGVS